MSEQVDIKSIDNRDQYTTWLWINDHQYVEVNPVDLLRNMIENLPEIEQPPLMKIVKKLEGYQGDLILTEG